MVTIEDVARDRHGGAPRDLLDVIREHILTQVLSGHASLNSAARSMDTSTRTLQRELNRAGTDFRSLASAAEFQRATELLRHTNGSINQVSAELGYSSPADFAQRFERPPAERRGIFAPAGRMAQRRQHSQIAAGASAFAALAFILPGETEIADKLEPGAVEHPEHARRQFDYGRAVA